MNYIDHKYIGLLSSRLRNFKRKGPSNYNFSCPFCNDSETDKSKARGYLYEKKGTSYFFCHNLCGGKSFANFLKQLDARLYQEWRLESLKQEGKVKEPTHEIDFSTKTSLRLNIISESNELLRQLPTITELSIDHPARKILHARKIPEVWHPIILIIYCLLNMLSIIADLINGLRSR